MTLEKAHYHSSPAVQLDDLSHQVLQSQKKYMVVLLQVPLDRLNWTFYLAMLQF
jgi:hypothetical protein